MPETKITYIGGPTALLEIGGLRLLTDPTFDPPGDYQYLHKLQSPAMRTEELPRVDAILLSHDHHADNLDRAGRELLASAGKVVTTTAGAARLAGNSIGLEPWQTVELGPGMKVTATPARHGPAHLDRGPVVGFVLESADAPLTYITGDTVWYGGVQEVADRYEVRLLLLFLGAARVAQVGPDHLTMTAAEGVIAARAFPRATIVPLHFEGWAHFSESRAEIEKTFVEAGLQARLHWPSDASLTHY